MEEVLHRLAGYRDVFALPDDRYVVVGLAVLALILSVVSREWLTISRTTILVLFSTLAVAHENLQLALATVVFAVFYATGAVGRRSSRERLERIDVGLRTLGTRIETFMDALERRSQQSDVRQRES